MGLTEFQTDLNNGMSIETALQKHNLTLHKAFNTLHEQINPKRKPPKPRYKPLGIPNIYQIGTKYYIKKTIKGKGRLYGSYNSLEDALRMKQALEEDGWHQRHVDRICNELGIKRSLYFNNKVRYH